MSIHCMLNFMEITVDTIAIVPQTWITYVRVVNAHVRLLLIMSMRQPDVVSLNYLEQIKYLYISFFKINQVNQKTNLASCNSTSECCCGQGCYAYQLANGTSFGYACQCASNRWWNNDIPYCRKRNANNYSLEFRFFFK